MKKILRTIIILASHIGIVFLLSSCSSGLSSIYDFDYPLSKAYTKSISGNLNIQVPQGWFVAHDNENNTVDLWLVKDDYSATIKFVSISFNLEAAKSLVNDDLLSFVELNKVLVKSKLGKSFKGFTYEEQFGNSTTFFAYQYSDAENQLVRTVVFNVNQQFYESTAFALKSENHSEIFKAQNSVLASIK